MCGALGRVVRPWSLFSVLTPYRYSERRQRRTAFEKARDSASSFLDLFKPPPEPVPDAPMRLVRKSAGRIRVSMTTLFDVSHSGSPGTIQYWGAIGRFQDHQLCRFESFQVKFQGNIVETNDPKLVVGTGSFKSSSPNETLLFEAVSIVELFSVHLVGNAPHVPDPSVALSETDRHEFTKDAPRFDITHPSLITWMNANKLWRSKTRAGTTETEVNLARRVIMAISKGTEFQFIFFSKNPFFLDRLHVRRPCVSRQRTAHCKGLGIVPSCLQWPD